MQKQRLIWFVYRCFLVDELVSCIADKRFKFSQQDVRSFFSPKGKTSKPGASKFEDKRGKHSNGKPASKDPAKTKVNVF